MKKFVLTGIGLLFLVLSPGALAVGNSVCNPEFPGWGRFHSQTAPESQRVAWKTKRATVKLARQAGMPQGVQGPILTSTPVNLNNFEQSSLLGRIIASETSSCLARLGFQIADKRVRKDSVLMRGEEGAFLLSRDTRELAEQQEARTVMVGTYLKRPRGARIELRLLRAEDNKILGATGFWVEKTALNEAGGDTP
ncbi:MAG TPA: FlgO family outer membrane protein [Gammaproteobacteria bacterium]|nr:FlgO family outer membrane protein [Gammaproteobacteria bacterium]